MLRQILNWRTLLAAVAISIVIGTIFYSRYLGQKIAKEEKQKVEQWVQAGKFVINSKQDADITFASMIIRENKSIPIVETDEHDKPSGESINLDAEKIARDSNYLRRKVRQFRGAHPPIEWVDPQDSTVRLRYYYGDSKLLNEVRYYPIIQLCIVALFIIITFFSIRSSYRSTQNQVWAGMAKETAHQLGTPVSSLEGWVEMLRESGGNEKIVVELGKDVDRLRLVSDRFGKIGSKPNLEEVDLVNQIRTMVDYMKKRAAGKINFTVNTHGHDKVIGKVSPPLFDWVIENLLKNALDAMEGKGSISADINEDSKAVYIEIADSGKGISKKNINNVFKPGFTTKKRGWGLGLSLSKRIIEQFHKGEIYVKQSEPGKGTTFRIVLKK